MRLNFKEWLLNEGFKEIKEKFINQGVSNDIIDKYIELFKEIKNKKYKQINDDIYGLENVKNRLDIDSYNTFHELEILVDYVSGQVDVKPSNLSNHQISEKPIYEDDDLQIYYADSPHACVNYKGNVPYGWCVARNDSSNLFYAYRFKEHKPSFYFVKNKEKTKKEFGFWNLTKTTFSGKFNDKYHFFIIQVVKNADTSDLYKKQYIVTSAMNDGDRNMSWQEIVQNIEPKLHGKQEILKPIPLTEEQENFYDKYKNGISNEDFKKLNYKNKNLFMDVYVRLDKGLNDDQFSCLPEDLKNKYIGFAVGLTDNQYDLIKNTKLLKRYQKITKEKIKKIFQEGLTVDLKNSEIEIFNQNFDDLTKDVRLDDFSIYKIINFSSDKIKTINWILQNKKELTSSNIWNFLEYLLPKLTSTQIIDFLSKHKIDININHVHFILANTKKEDINEMLDFLLKNIKDFDPDIASKILSLTPKLKRDDVIYSFLNLKNKKEFDDVPLLHMLFYYCQNEENLISFIIANFQKISNRVYEYLIGKSKNPYQLVDFIIKNKEISQQDARNLEISLLYTNR